PSAIEFWQGQPDRLHDRFQYVRDGEGWRILRLAP
ncbi:MAG: pyridoxamine 5'-phosphate oxidase, partial [Deltaproteobacteria bacterium]|nr:pyridoxamine 5'-phosphate oxidase [Deltaproteobacteria bacterium]